ncbi:MAG: hypothetical protein CL833_12660 [Crocinitomicaceae bacterium]|nr:hypothetical protein [Crocinitomicaceae bacterium]|tara:strand:- start:947 stop:1777 length:831 start_codon:yes stop_codon:yes gene_type:complete
MTNKFRNYFHYSASERNGLIVLLVLIILAVTGVLLRDYFTDDSESFKAMDLHALLEQANGTESKNDNLPTVLQEFDPNKLDQTGWINLGFSEKQAASIIKYRDKAGEFNNPEDLLKLYAIDTMRYNELKPFVRIEKSIHRKKKTILNINSCDSTQLIALPGIGSYRAHKILKFRNLLGGFNTKNQVLETYGIDSSVFIQIQDYIRVEENSWSRIDLNSASLELLEKHPYISNKTAESIVFHRETIGPFQSNNDIVHMGLISGKLYVKLQPYLMPIK